MKTIKSILVTASAVLCLATLPLSALQYHWTGGAATTDWFTAGNWQQNSGFPDTGDSPRLGINASYNPTLWPHYNGDNSASPTDGAFLIAQVMEAWFYLEGGTYLHNSWVNLGNGGGFTGHWVQTGGTFNNDTRQFSIGQASPGDFLLSGGTLVTGDFRLSTSSTGFGTGVISGTGWVTAGQAQIGMFNTGTLTIQDDGRLQLNTVLNLGNAANNGVGVLELLGGKTYADSLAFNTATSRIRLDGGTLELGGDETGNAEAWITGGNLYTTLPGGSVSYAYDSGQDRTVFTAAIPEPAILSLLCIGALSLVASRKCGRLHTRG